MVEAKEVWFRSEYLRIEETIHFSQSLRYFFVFGNIFLHLIGYYEVHKIGVNINDFLDCFPSFKEASGSLYVLCFLLYGLS